MAFGSLTEPSYITFTCSIQSYQSMHKTEILIPLRDENEVPCPLAVVNQCVTPLDEFVLPPTNSVHETNIKPLTHTQPNKPLQSPAVTRLTTHLRYCLVSDLCPL